MSRMTSVEVEKLSFRKLLETVANTAGDLGAARNSFFGASLAIEHARNFEVLSAELRRRLDLLVGHIKNTSPAVEVIEAWDGKK